METGDTRAVSRIVVAAFMDSVASGLSQEGVATFTALSTSEAFADRMNGDNDMFVYEDTDGIVGMVELKEGRHLAMLFVSPTAQRRGIGRALVATALQRSRGPVVTVSAAVSSVAAYEAYGFEVTGPEGEELGLRYVPMEIATDR